ncbi:MAG TPA: aldo/keto reductase [Anaerovoracaceae bacterium]|nr:aldo/keto reductase [Anaerovoracaceae bacterium]
MQYREMGKTGDKVSILGYGCMRFPKTNGKIDEERTKKQIISAIEKGVNYFDTAYMYPNSETILGNILAEGYREKVMIASKIPPFMVHSRKDMDTVLETQLKRLKTDYIDYYLIHSITTKEGWERMKQLGAVDFLEKAKAAGKIKRIGFSYHGEGHDFKEIVDDYPWDFCQIQYNYMDENAQAGMEGLRYAASKNLGIAVMEPLRGGLLAGNMPLKIEKIWSDAAIGGTPAEWALRWVWNHPEVSVVLSGMNQEDQIEENIRIAETARPNSLADVEVECINKVKTALREKLKVGCTGCGYCMPCPAGVNIPVCFSYYNDKSIYEDKTAGVNYMGMLAGADGGKPSFASLCKDCGKCERHCPQGLPIRKHLKEVSKDMEPFYFKPLVGMIGGYYKIRGMFSHR